MTDLRGLSRRDTYLVVWGVAYLALAVAWWIGPRQVLWPMWIVMFSAAGVVSLSAVAADGRRWQAAAFAGLIGASAIRACWHLWDVIVTGDWRASIYILIVWTAVAAGQLVVAGWPDNRRSDDLAV